VISSKTQQKNNALFFAAVICGNPGRED